ncbi:MAG: hypothetical protein CM15mP49_08580 [Actinomycetota bacterium]|nr:MAG: hypothetical protein CM15mP49_08580 [Actinomycetota bacterium]
MAYTRNRASIVRLQCQGNKGAFTPHLAPMNRGIIATSYGKVKAP